MELNALVYKILFGDVPDKLPNPNKPENIPRIKAMQESKGVRFKRFWEGAGSVLFERWNDKIRANIFSLLVEEHECNCKTCNKIREISTIVKLLSEAQLIIDKE